MEVYGLILTGITLNLIIENFLLYLHNNSKISQAFRTYQTKLTLDKSVRPYKYEVKWLM